MGKICTDAGHGGSDSGAVWRGIKEKDLNLEYTVGLNDRLKQLGHTVYTTRDSDYHVPPLSVRCKLVNLSHQKEPFQGIVSLHCNVAASADGRGGYRIYPASRGLYVIYHNNSPIGEQLARTLVDTLKAAQIPLNHGGLITTQQLGRKLAWLHKTQPPAVLIELGFMTNPDDLGRLLDPREREKLLDLLAQGFDRFLKNTP